MIIIPRILMWFLSHMLALALTVIAFAGCNTTSTMHVSVRPPTFLDSLLEQTRNENSYPALSTLILYPDGTTEISAVGSRKQGAPYPVTPTDKWHLGSNTKAFTSTLAARLVERNILRWNTTIGEILGHRMPIHEQLRGATLELLLCHRAGLSRNFPDGPAKDNAAKGFGSIHQQRLDLAASILSGPPRYLLGTQSEYSNAGVVIAGTMMEEVTGKTWEQLLFEEVIDPLGIRSAGFGAPGSKDSVDQPWGHQPGPLETSPVPPGPKADNLPAIAPSGTLHMNLPDYALFMRDQILGEYGQGELLSQRSYRYLHSDSGRTGFGALGWYVRRTNEYGTSIFHSGSNGYWFHRVWLSIDKKVGIVIAANTSRDAETVFRKILDTLRQRIFVRNLKP